MATNLTSALQQSSSPIAGAWRTVWIRRADSIDRRGTPAAREWAI